MLASLLAFALKSARSCFRQDESKNAAPNRPYKSFFCLKSFPFSRSVHAAGPIVDTLPA